MIERIFITSLTVFAIWYSMLEGEVFGWLGKFIHNHTPTWAHSPLYDCPVCMIPYYGTALYWLAWGVNWQQWLLTIIPAMGLNVVITRMWPKEEVEVINRF